MEKVCAPDILDFLQTIYPVRLDVLDIPSSLQEPFWKAVKRFEKPNELKNLDRSRVGICEEVADLTYQVLKLICLRENILNEKNIRTLQDYLFFGKHYDPDGALIDFDYPKLDALSVKLVPDDLVRDLRYRLPDVLFTPHQDNGVTITRDFLGGQFIAFISRLWRGHAMGGLQAAEHMRDKKIPEETRELIEALIKSGEKLAGNRIMDDIKLNLDLADKLVVSVQYFIDAGDTNLLLPHLAVILMQKMSKPVRVEDTLRLMFLKMKGRQELDFMGVPEQTMRYICKPAEYLIEADMFF